VEAMRGLRPHLSIGNRIASGGREELSGQRGLFCPLENVFRLKARGDTRGHRAVLSFRNVFRLDVARRRKDHGPVLSFGNRIASGGREGL